jgi:23S rRNA (uracil1939-C5)-methyltransferase
MATRISLDIAALSPRGHGLGRAPWGFIEVPFALPGETIEAEVEGTRGRLVALGQTVPERVPPPCPHFGTCGGCSLQHFDLSAYAEWKQSMIVSILSKSGLNAPVLPLVDAHGVGRRRIVLHARRGPNGEARLGFMAERTHDLVEIRDCLVLAPELKSSFAAARDLAKLLMPLGPAFDLQFTAVLGGIDADMRGLPRQASFSLVEAARICERHGILRLSIKGEPVLGLQPPLVDCGGVKVPLPPGAFLQATAAGEEALAAFILERAQGAKRAADLFCGIGTFALRLARQMPVLAVDADGAALDALASAVRHAQGMKPVTALRRNLFKEPLTATELDAFDLVVFDPPRQGAEAQALEFACSRVKRIIAISCLPATFARDAAILVDAGYVLKEVSPIDQFRWSAHVELAALFVKASKPR